MTSSVKSVRERGLHWLGQSAVLGPLVTLVLVLVLFSAFVPKFYSWRTFSNILNATSISATVTLGVTMLMISGEFDLSVGALVAAGGYLFAEFTVDHDLPLLALALAVLVPAALGAVNGVIRVWTRMPSFLVTLGTLAIFRGLVWWVSDGALVQTLDRPEFYEILNGRIDNVFGFLEDRLPNGANFRTASLWILGLAIVLQYVLARTRYGNHVMAVGGNPEAARAQGVKVSHVKIINFALSGALAGFAGVLMFSQFRTVRVASGAGVELTAIAAAVVGGTLMTGGFGSIMGGLVGILLISTLNRGVVLLDISFIPPDNFEAVVGATIVGAAIMNNWLRRQT